LVNCGIPVPEQTVCDQPISSSLALLSAIVKFFSWYTTLQDYVGARSSLFNGDVALQSHLDQMN